MCDRRNKFCYICGLFVDAQHRVELKTNIAISEAFNNLFNINKSFSESAWYEPEYACTKCSSAIKKWRAAMCKKQPLPFLKPMIWHHQIYHKPSIPPIKGEEVIIRSEISDLENSFELDEENADDPEIDNTFFPSGITEQHLVSNNDFRDLVRDLGLSQRQTETLGSRLKQWKLVEKDFKATFLRDHNLSFFEQVFRIDETEKNLVYCTDINELFHSLNHVHKPEEWRLFLDGSCKSLKAVLLHNENQLPSVPIAYAVDMKETYTTMKKILDLVSYDKYQWQMVSDLKVLTILFGMQGGYTKFPCYLCEWDSRAKDHYKHINWPPRERFQIGKKNVVNIPLVQSDKIILPPLHLKLGFMKQFVKRLQSDGEAFSYLQTVFPRLSDAKIKEGIFVGPQIRKLFCDTEFVGKLNNVEQRAWKSFISLCKIFLGNHRSDNYIEVVNEFLEAYEQMGCRMSMKIHFLHSHLDFFPENLGQFSDEQGERFHQELLEMEKRFVGKSQIRMLANYCWSLKRDTDDVACKRKRYRKHF